MPQPRDPHTRRRSPALQAGFTLTELMVAMVILGVGLLSVGSLFVFSQRHSYSGRAETTAACLAEEIREKILSENFDDVKTIFDNADTDVPETLTLPCMDWANHVHEGLGPGGRGRIQVRDPLEDAQLFPGMFSVEIRISWQQQGEHPEIVLHFCISQVGVQSRAGGGA